MNLEKEAKKLMRGSDPLIKSVLKYMVTYSNALDDYKKNYDTKINHARNSYEFISLLNRGRAKKRNIDLWVLLSDKYMIPEERHLIKPPNTLKGKKRQDWIEKEFKPYFYEWIHNYSVIPLIYAFNKGWESYRKRGKKRGEQGTLKKNIREVKIIQTARELDVKKLLDTGVKKKDIWKLVADSIPNENVKYVRQILAPLKYNP